MLGIGPPSASPVPARSHPIATHINTAASSNRARPSETTEVKNRCHTPSNTASDDANSAQWRRQNGTAAKRFCNRSFLRYDAPVSPLRVVSSAEALIRQILVCPSFRFVTRPASTRASV